MISSVHLCRGLAALAVVFYHVYLILLQKTGVSTFGGVATYGYLGVPYFFVLSGFIITQAHLADVNRPERLREYIWKRFSRVYPVYWIFSLGFLAVALSGFGDAEFAGGPVHFLEYFSLIHFTSDFSAPPLKMAWTLFYEVRFYALFGLAIYNSRLALSVFILWLIGIVGLEPTNALTNELLSFWSFAFVFGVCANLAYRVIDLKWWWLVTIAGVLLVLCVFAGGALELKDKRSWMIFPVSLGFAGTMLGLALAEKARPFRIGAIGKKLGDASYSIYLTHSAAISTAVVIIKKLHVADYIPFSVLFVSIFVGAVAGGVIAHEIVEKPVTNYIRRIKGKRQLYNSAA